MIYRKRLRMVYAPVGVMIEALRVDESSGELRYPVGFSFRRLLRYLPFSSQSSYARWKEGGVYLSVIVVKLVMSMI